jgi:hypothetical protein
MNVEEAGYHEWIIDGEHAVCTVEDCFGFVQLSLSLNGQVSVTPSTARFIDVDFALDEDDAVDLIQVLIEGAMHACVGDETLLDVLTNAAERLAPEVEKQRAALARMDAEKPR